MVDAVDFRRRRAPVMTDLLDRAIARTRSLPPEMQDEVARMLLLYAGESELFIQLTPEEEADLAEAEAEVDRGEFATDEEVRAVFAKYGA